MAGEAAAWEFVTNAGLPAEAIRSAVGYRGTAATPAIHRGLPSPSLTFIFSLDEPIVAGHSPEQATGPRAYRNDIVVGGLHTTPAYIAQPKAQAGIQLAVRPLVSRALFGVPAGELRTLTTEGADVLGPAATRLREQLAEAPTWDERFPLLERYVRARLAEDRRGAQPRPEVAEAWRWLAWHRGTGSIASLARHVMLSERQLGTVFRAEFGLSPKAASRLMRFEHARQRVVGMATAESGRDLARIAHECGYYDHSHLVRDFQKYTGTSPTRWIAEERENVQVGAVRDG